MDLRFYKLNLQNAKYINFIILKHSNMIDKKYKYIVAIILICIGLAYAVYEIRGIGNIFNDNLKQQLYEKDEFLNSYEKQYGEKYPGSIEITLPPELMAIYKLMNAMLLLFIVSLIYGNLDKFSKAKKNN